MNIYAFCWCVVLELGVCIMTVDVSLTTSVAELCLSCVRSVIICKLVVLKVVVSVMLVVVVVVNCVSRRTRGSVMEVVAAVSVWDIQSHHTLNCLSKFKGALSDCVHELSARLGATRG